MISRVVPWLTAIALLMAVAACSSNNSPQVVAEQFWQAVMVGDLEAAKSLATEDSKNRIRLSEGIGSIQLGKVQHQKELALVATSLAKSAGDTLLELSFDTALEPENGKWRVNFNRTVKSMVSNSSAQLWQALSESVNDVGSSIGDAVDQALDDAAGEVNEALQDMAEEMQKAADELRKDK